VNEKYIGLFDDQKKETKNEIYELEDIFNLSKDLLDVVAAHDGGKD
jgi:predicted type IV restriction endonuclease